MINERYRFSVFNARAYPGASTKNDHNPGIAYIKIHLRALKRPKRKPKLLLDILKSPESSAAFSKTTFENLPKNQTEENFHNQSTNLKTSIITAVNKLKPQESKKIKQPHGVSNEIKNLLHKRRKFKLDPEKYSRIQKEIQK